MLARQAFYKFSQKYNSIQFVYYANKYIEIQTIKKYSLYPVLYLYNKTNCMF